ncbi:hypothetical protein MmiHf6_13880 [Methanimicrococcus hongohii]|uniref:Uncharacterized protein n=1 Tax=Methanimicrococcus hongohii TaxID=3028295 RepID=A0AA96V0H7_9EURY|nr:hypothetical protein MmiHf6_13840 [Methanimicrococcus sp. Hf6]WNY24063.1 hypothetical protein MmiHf6_13880 [Methanimicrococcus sp. Hf6]
MDSLIKLIIYMMIGTIVFLYLVIKGVPFIILIIASILFLYIGNITKILKIEKKE